MFCCLEHIVYLGDIGFENIVVCLLFFKHIQLVV
jgi:hypothetical protein